MIKKEHVLLDLVVMDPAAITCKELFVGGLCLGQTLKHLQNKSWHFLNTHNMQRNITPMENYCVSSLRLSVILFYIFINVQNVAIYRTL